MQTLDVKYTDRIHGFQGRLLKVVIKAELKIELGRDTGISDKDWKTRCALIKLTRRHHECACGARDVRASFRRTRYVQGEPLGELQTFYEVDMHLLSCNVCGKTWHESLPFLSHPMSRITKSFTKLMIRFRESMSIADVARSLGVDWRCVKDAEKAHLALKCRNNSLKGVSAITIDETCLFPHERPSRKYVTIVREAATGSPHVRLRRFAGRRRLERTDCTSRLLHDPAGRRLAVLPETPHGDLRSRAVIVAALLAVFTVRRAADCITGRVTRVSDGDTVWVTNAAKLRHKVRLDRIDAPEKDQPWGKESAAALKRWEFVRVVRVEYEKHDRYGRLGPRAG